MAIQNGFAEYYLIRSDEKTRVNFNAVASVKLLLPHVLQSLSKPCIKIECKVRKTKDYRSFFVRTLTEFPQEERAWLLKVLSSSCPGWQCPGLHCDWGGHILVGPHSSVLICLCAWGNDIVSEKLWEAISSMILGLREKPRVQTGNLTARTVPLLQAMENRDLQFSSEQLCELNWLCRLRTCRKKKPWLNGCWQVTLFNQQSTSTVAVDTKIVQGKYEYFFYKSLYPRFVFFLNLICIGVCPACMFVWGSWIHWNLSYKHLWATNMGAGNWTWVLWKSSQCFKQCAISPGLNIQVFQVLEVKAPQG